MCLCSSTYPVNPLLLAESAHRQVRSLPASNQGIGEMAPKEQKSKKAIREKSAQRLDDATFGLKNKNKSKKAGFRAADREGSEAQ